MIELITMYSKFLIMIGVSGYTVLLAMYMIFILTRGMRKR